MDDFSIIWEARLDAQTLVLMFLELNFPCPPHRHNYWVGSGRSVHLKIVKDGWENEVSIPG